MSNSYFQFKQFIIHQDRCAMKITTDACLFGAWIAEKMKNEKLKIKNVLEVGAGTGLLSLIFTQKNPDAVIDAIEIDEDSFLQAKENIAASPFTERIQVLHGDATTFPFKKKYDLIISNPPFYENELKSGNEKKNIAHHNEGLVLEELLKIIRANISENGVFCLLLPYKRNQEIKKLFEKFQLLQITFIRQSVSHDYFRIMLMGKLKADEAETAFHELSIWDANQQYTKDFTDLLKDYYLKL